MHFTQISSRQYVHFHLFYNFNENSTFNFRYKIEIKRMADKPLVKKKFKSKTAVTKCGYCDLSLKETNLDQP